MEFFTLLTVFSIGVLGYHYTIYPAIIALWARWRPATASSGLYTPSVSLIITAYNEAAVMVEKLENSLALDYPTDLLEIIVVTDGSTDDTAVLAAKFQDRGIRLLHDPVRRGKSAAMNRATAVARGDIILFSDANAFYQPDALLKLLRHFQNGRVGGVSGNKTVKPGPGGVSQSSGLYWRYESAIKKWESQTGSTVAVVGEMFALRRTLFAPIPPEVINDDAYLATLVLRQGLSVLYEPEAVCWETASESTADELTRRRRISAGRYQLLFAPRWWPWRYPAALFQLVSHKFLRLLLPFFMILALVANTAVLLRRPKNFLMGLVFLGQLAVYMLAGLGWLAEKRQKKAKIPAAAYYIVSGNFSSLQGLWRLLSGKQSVLWEKARRE
ncbi:MAG: glycosyltransferase family 2 protein [Chloroflexi bacterium]|nr:glycosyltransferase family 2 protein [Chloroflexota bacterium]